jgi:prepilin-type processing-associated H-X9-DG protein
MPRRAFTYIELLALLGVAGILLAIFVPYLSAVRESDRRLRCQDNLRRLRDALQTYAGENRNNYPRTLYDPRINRDGYTAFTGADAGNPFSVAVGPSDVTASLWLLVRGRQITDLSVFVCPSTRDWPDRSAGAVSRSNFHSPANLSYSYASPFSGFSEYHLNSDWLGASCALMADKNPGVSAASVAHDADPLELAKANSPNHGRAGQNVLYADGSVSFQMTPYCGAGRDPDAGSDGDNIYTALAPHPLAGDRPFYAGNGFVGRQFGPSYRYDSYLVPTEEDGP